MSTAGGVDAAPARGAEIGATAIQIFTKTPNQWREPKISEEDAERFRTALAATRIGAVVSHDSYLINLASPVPALRARSINSFKDELTRCRTLGVPYLVTHPGNYMDERALGLTRNATAYEQCLAAVPGPIILIETTAGAGTALGSTFDELAALRDRVRPELRERIGFCADTCHLHAAGYDLVDDWDGVWRAWDETIGLEHLKCLHLNDSVAAFGTRRDRHALIGEGTMGPAPFRRAMRDQRFARMIKIIETPKGDDAKATDRRMLRRLRAYRSAKSAR